MTADMVAKGTIEREKQHIIRYGIADPAIFIKNGGPSIGETMSLHGCAWKKADNKRIPGWQQVRQRLVGVDGEPMLYLDETCTALMEQLQTIQHDEGDPEDLDTESEDHALDELRYACMSRPWIVGEPKSSEKNLHKGRAAPTIAELIARTKSNLKKRVQRL
jgi:hypothetical protein